MVKGTHPPLNLSLSYLEVKMGWYRVYKTFQGGCYPSKNNEYIEVPKGTRLGEVQGYAEEWADRTPGGHNYGYRVYWTRVSRPSKVWLKGRCSDLKKSIAYEENQLKKLELMITG